MRISLVQMQCEKGKPRQNLAKIERYINRAEVAGADIICFPELSIPGYINPKKHPKLLWTTNSSWIKRFCALTRHKDILVIAGFAEKNPLGRPFISLAAAARGKLVGIYRKRNLGKNERGLFASGKDSPTFQVGKTKYGLSICADIDKEDSFRDAARNGAKIIFHAAAPGLYGRRRKTAESWERGYNWWQNKCKKYLSRYAKTNKIYIASTAQCGATVDEDFPGGMYVFSPNGKCIAQSNSYTEASLVLDLPIG